MAMGHALYPHGAGSTLLHSSRLQDEGNEHRHSRKKGEILRSGSVGNDEAIEAFSRWIECQWSGY